MSGIYVWQSGLTLLAPDVFPMTASQKIQKYKLREMAHELWPDA